ncbi:MAG: prolyl oligopeptidase family serine peptidase, partial [Anaerolineales bacterium]
CNLEDQRLYRQDGTGAPRALSPASSIPAGLRYADMRFSPDGRVIVCIEEAHTTNAPPINRIVSFPCDGSGPPHSLVEGRDFYSSPRLSPDGRCLAWLQWDHPNMPWDGTELWRAEIGEGFTLVNRRQVAGGVSESIFQPDWSPESVLHFVSDRTGWWNLYRLQGDQGEPLARREAEFGSPGWSFGQAHYAFLRKGRIACLAFDGGTHWLAVIEPRGGLQPLHLPWTTFLPTLAADPQGNRIWIVGASDAVPHTLLEIDAGRGSVNPIRPSARFAIDGRYISSPESLWFPSISGDPVQAYFYPAHNPDFVASQSARPPLLVNCHGGPTGSTFPDLKPSYQYWTSRGFALLDVNYGGSAGFGRAYRQRLAGRWGIVDVRDCVEGARDQVGKGRVDGGRLAIRGGSAGGFTALCALTFHDVFHSGASYYGVADLEALARETHKFESRYLDRLVGPYPEAASVYRERSPLNSADRLTCPVIFFQGLDDPVVPPAQAETMVAALIARRVPHAYLTFSGESHGFRRAEVRARCLEAELYFYSKIFRFDLPEPVESVPIANV